MRTSPEPFARQMGAPTGRPGLDAIFDRYEAAQNLAFLGLRRKMGIPPDVVKICPRRPFSPIGRN